MALNSTMVPLGTPLPDFTLPDLDGNPVNLGRLRADGVLLVAFVANHCPYVRHVERQLMDTLNQRAHPDLAVVAISSNDVSNYPDDDVDGMREQATRAGWDFPYLRDADQSAAKQFGAACTPDFFLYGRDGRLAYRGALDGSSPKNGVPLTGELLTSALEQVLADQPVPEPHRPSMGCGIKWITPTS